MPEFSKTLNSFQNNEDLLHEILCGLEKESLRINKDATLALTPHPKSLGHPLENPNITTDFFESQLEFITPPFSKPTQTLEFLKKLHKDTQKKIAPEQIWPSSMPCLIPEGEIPIAKYGPSEEGQKREIYRKGLALRYGKKIQMICGIHYNLSFTKKFWQKFQTICNDNQNLQDFINEKYFALIRNFLRYRWLPVYLFGASPVADKSYCKSIIKKLKQLDNKTCYLQYATSLRMSQYGYSNYQKNKVLLSFNSLDQYIKEFKTALNTSVKEYQELNKKHKGEQLNENLLQIENEYYCPIRAKQIPEAKKSLIESLEEKGINHIEIRAVDLNPFYPCGIEKTEVLFFHAFLCFCLLRESPPISKAERTEINQNQTSTALQGRDPNLKLHKNAQEIPLKTWAEKILKKTTQIAQMLDKNQNNNDYTQSLKEQMKKIKNPNLTPSAQILNQLKQKNQSFIDFGKEIIKNQK